MMNKLLTLTILSFISFCSFAEYKKILRIINTENNEPATLFVNLKNDQLDGIKLKTLRRTSIYNYDEVKKGTTLLTKSGISIISVSAPNVNPYTGGGLNLTYLKNFSILHSSYGKIYLNITKKNGNWVLLNGSETTDKLLLTPHAFGIESYKFE